MYFKHDYAQAFFSFTSNNLPNQLQSKYNTALFKMYNQQGPTV